MCICDMGKVLSKTHLKNEHCEKKELTLNLIKDDSSYGIAIFEKNTTIAVFEIKYCPLCGEKLKLHGHHDEFLRFQYAIEKLDKSLKELDKIEKLFFDRMEGLR